VVVCALVTDLMDRSRLSAAIPGVQFTLVDDADVVIVDLARFADRVPSIRASHPDARIVGFGPHVDDFSSVDADVVLPRSKFFRDPAAYGGRGES
jgi:hypothetical protein